MLCRCCKVMLAAGVRGNGADLSRHAVSDRKGLFKKQLQELQQVATSTVRASLRLRTNVPVELTRPRAGRGQPWHGVHILGHGSREGLAR
jgi:hypothetical protein